MLLAGTGHGEGVAPHGGAARTARPTTDEPARLKGKTITYRVTPSGLVIEVEGLRLEPRVKPQRMAGGFGVRLHVDVHVTDEHTHHLMNPEHGPLMIAEEIEGAGRKNHVGDERKGNDELLLRAGESTAVDRTVSAVIRSGQTLKLQVGLWGLARDNEERKPLKKLFVVTMVAGTRTPEPVITPPE